MSLLVSKNEVSTNSLAWSFVINPTLRPFSFKRFATSHRRLVFPAPKNPPTKIKSVLFVIILFSSNLIILFS